jgi:bifunctional DNA-binding transcriptional regulator/antitoxin component of YhaV-PrlF toxin-antitoxin module
MKNEKKIEGKVSSWGVRIQVPAPVIKGIGLEVGDEVLWTIEEVGGKKAAILRKKEVEG